MKKEEEEEEEEENTLNLQRLSIDPTNTRFTIYIHNMNSFLYSLSTEMLFLATDG